MLEKNELEKDMVLTHNVLVLILVILVAGISILATVAVLTLPKSLIIDPGYWFLGSITLALILTIITVYYIIKHQELFKQLREIDKMSEPDKIYMIIKVILFINLKLPFYNKHVEKEKN